MSVSKGLLRTYYSLVLLSFKFLDLLIVFALGILTYYLTFQTPLEQALPKSLVVFSLFFHFLIAQNLDLYRPWHGRRLRAELGLIGTIGLLSMGGILVTGLIINPQFVSDANPQWLLTWFTATIVSQAMLRLMVRGCLKAIRARGLNQRRLLLVGANRNAQKIMNELRNHPEYGLQIVGYVDDRTQTRDGSLRNLEYLGTTENIEEIARELSVDEIWITYPSRGEARAKQVLDKLRFTTINTRYVLDLRMFKDNEKTLTVFAGIPLLDVDVSPMDGALNRAIKNIEDRSIAFLALIALSPLFLLLSVGVKLSSPGPVFYRQVRISWNNKPFEMLKFRSMPVDVENETGPKWASAGEKRATTFGAFLRKTSLDELPQLINVLRGEMSIVGPRPERPEFVEQFKDKIPDYMKKHMVKAGITGWAQVNGYRGDTDLSKRIEHDLYYIRYWTPLFDLQIAIETIYKGFIHKNAY